MMCALNSGAGLVGQELIAQLSKVQSRHLIKVVLIATSKKLIKDASGLELPLWRRAFDSSAEAYTSFDTIKSFLDSLPPETVTIFVDCTASDEVPSHYPEILEREINIATPNKKGLSGRYQLLDDIQQAVEMSGAMIYFEATVGAGLPII